jgi:hypothetical protein
MRPCIALFILSLSTPVHAQSIGTSSGAMSMVDISNPASTSSTSRLTTTPTVVAPGLAAAGVETCLGSASGGLSVMGGGITFGSTRVDQGCTIRLLARQLFAFGFQKAALALMCQDERVAAAMDATGSPCPYRPAEIRQSERVSSMPAQSFATEEPAKSFTSDDQAEPLTSEAQVKPFTQEEQLMFERASNMK